MAIFFKRMTREDIKTEIEYYERMLRQQPDGKEIWEAELRKLRKYDKSN